jgi:putative LysE/RhtB family amino acid efflux pump
MVAARAARATGPGRQGPGLPRTDMDLLLFFLKGAAAGFVVAAPMGPVAAMTVRKTMTQGMVAGIAIGLGAALADTVFAILAATGAGFVAGLMIEHAFWFRLVGCVLLLVLAVRTLLSAANAPEPRRIEGMAGDFLYALAVTGTNPITIIGFGVVFAALGLVAAGGAMDWSGAVVAGVFVGAMAWWTLLSAIAGLIRPSVGLQSLRWVNRVSAAVIAACGVFILFGALAPHSPVARVFDLPFG